jgi:hypothetical protein
MFPCRSIQPDHHHSDIYMVSGVIGMQDPGVTPEPFVVYPSGIDVHWLKAIYAGVAPSLLFYFASWG